MRHAGTLCAPAPDGETRSQRHRRTERETDVWMRMVRQLGPFPGQTTVVHVGDQGADLFPFFLACLANHTAFLVRVFENRHVEPDVVPQQYLLETIRAFPSQGSRPFSVPGTHGRTARQTDVPLSFGQIRVMPPRSEKWCGAEPLSLWAIRVWEENTPEQMSTATFWKAVAQLGGYLGRRGDGPPGWKTLWKGWLRVQTWLEGVHLAFHLRL